jgi:2-polyprenyl-3-methyl-5-hydroxy-6-metoxy-1,4-benzoquinol methylase
VCLFCEVIEHLVQDPAWALFNLASRLRVGGHIILTTPNPARLENISRLIFHSGSPGDPISGYGIHGRHNREYTLDELTSLLTGTGFKVLRSRTIDVAPGPWSKAAEVSGYGQYILIQGCLTGECDVCVKQQLANRASCLGPRSWSRLS